MSRLREKDGVAAVIVIIFFIALALVLMIFTPIISNRADEELNAIDEKYVNTAEKEAKILYAQYNEAFSEVFDAETKKFYKINDARKSVNPYGSSKEHIGKYILVTVDEKGSVTYEWISP